MIIFLVGFMGCGKSTFGKKLAKRFGYTFLDLDKEIERTTGLSIAGYFERYGEPAFRETERVNLQNTSLQENTIVATGGGLPCYFDNMEWMNVHGSTIYISMTPAALANRLLKGKEERPLIKNLTDEELVDFITGKLAEREPFYCRANYIFNGIDLTPEKVGEYLGLKTKEG